jgi:phospholipid/cholesterol/gamma-HCH transport system permease protein
MSTVPDIGRETIRRIGAFGDFCRFCGQALALFWSGLRWHNLRHVTPRLYDVGAASVPVVVVTGVFVGAVLAVQTVAQFRAMPDLMSRLGTVVNMSVLRELGPILAGVILAGRVGGGLTAELGTMRVTEQLDALRAMGADPIRVLVVPRLLACTLLIPALVIYGSFTGILGGYYVSVYLYGVNPSEFWRFAAESVDYFDIAMGPIKSVFFGVVIGLICCYKGFRCEAGAAGVGRACTQGFVACCLSILILDLFVGMVLNTLYEMFTPAIAIL